MPRVNARNVSRFGGLVGIAGLAAVAMQPANAATTTVGLLEGGSVLAEVTCSDTISPVCGGFYAETNDFSSEFATLFDQEGNANPSTVAGLLNNLAGTTFTGEDATRTEAGGQESATFTTAAEFFVLKLGNNFAFFQNFDDLITVDYDVIAQGAGLGLSNVTFFGGAPGQGPGQGPGEGPGITPIPVPAALPLFLGALGGLGFLGYRRRRTATV